VQITPEQQQKYADAAMAVMKKHGVIINDLHAHILPTIPQHGVAPDDVHFNAVGCDHLAKKVISALEEALKSPR